MTDRHTVDTINSDQLDVLYDERDGAYRERAHLVALLAAMTDGAVITYAPDVDEPGWQIVYLTLGGRQASWHISPRDAELFTHVERVEYDDPRGHWDGHTTEEKYLGIAAWTAELAQHCGPAETEHCPCNGTHFPNPTACRWCRCHRASSEEQPGA
jgi:hypothetical protein